MSNCWPPGEPAQSSDARPSIEEACTQFEEAWRAGRRPSIADFLPRQPTLVRSQLLAELLKRELQFRRAAGEQPTLGEYQQRFREHPAPSSSAARLANRSAARSRWRSPSAALADLMAWSLAGGRPLSWWLIGLSGIRSTRERSAGL
jgi:hypothetical protein